MILHVQRKECYLGTHHVIEYLDVKNMLYVHSNTSISDLYILSQKCFGIGLV